MPHSNSAKKMLCQYGIIAGSLGGMFLVLFGVTALTRGARERGLRAQTQTVLDRVFPGEYLVRETAEGMTLADATGMCFVLEPTQGKPFEKRHRVLISQVSTIFGTVPGVFLIRGGGRGGVVSFVGFGLYTKNFERAEGILRDSVIPKTVKLLESRLREGVNDQ